MSQQAIADRLGLTKGTVSRLLDTARREGYVASEVAENSRRERAVTLAPAGRLVVDAADRALDGSTLATFATEDPAAVRGTIAGLRGFIASIDQTT